MHHYWKRLDIKSKIAISYLIGLAAIAITIPLVWSASPNVFDPSNLGQPLAPSWAHPFGTDDLGRGLLIRSIYGARISLLVGLISVSISITLGTLYGIAAGYLAGRIDEVMMRVVDMLMAIPTIFLILSIQSMLTPNISNVMIVIGFTSWMGVSRLVRAETLSVKQRPFILAAKARGLSRRKIVFRHILPHTLNPIIVAAALGMGGAILTESVLSFLGLGVQPPHASWGNMLQNSLAYMRQAPWMTIVPGVLITLTVLALNIIGDTLRTAFNPNEHHA